MDIEMLIDQLKWWAEVCDRTNFGCQAKKTLQAAATALSTLQDENKELRAELDDLKKGHCAGCSIPAVKAERIRDLTEAPKLRAELEQVKRALAMMWFAYVNSDKETPHSYETEALEEVERILGPWGKCMPQYLGRGPEEG